jgi:predicted methyltransferase
MNQIINVHDKYKNQDNYKEKILKFFELANRYQFDHYMGHGYWTGVI